MLRTIYIFFKHIIFLLYKYNLYYSIHNIPIHIKNNKALNLDNSGMKKIIYTNYNNLNQIIFYQSKCNFMIISL